MSDAPDTTSDPATEEDLDPSEINSSDLGEDNYDDDGGDGGDEGQLSEMDLLREEIKLLKSKGYKAGFMRHEVTLSIIVSFPITQFQPSHLRACGLDATKNIVVQILFNQTPPVYLSGCPQSKEIIVRQSSDTDLDRATLEDLSKFGLWWTLEQRLFEFIKENWDQLVHSAKGELERMNVRNKSVNLHGVERLMHNAHELGITSVDERVAHYIFERSRNSLDEAQERFLVDDKALSRAAQEAMVRPWYKGQSGYEDFSMLLKVVNFLYDRIKRSTENCLVCGARHPVRLLKPVVCGEQLCNFQAVELGLGVDLESEILHFPFIVDFMICSAYAGASYGKHFKAPWEASEVATVLQRTRPVQEMQDRIRQGGRKGEFKQWLESIHPLLYKVLHWIVSTNRSHIALLPEQYHISELGTKYQFILNATHPEAEETFQRLKKEAGGSFYAFHGSPLGNWHSILREGLKPKNYTTAFGPGIYMATNALTSFNYMRQAQAFPQSRFGANLRVMALCEVVDHGTVKSCKKTVHRPGCVCNKSSPHYRVESEEYTVTRFLFLWNEGSTPQGCDATKLKDRLERVVQATKTQNLI